MRCILIIFWTPANDALFISCEACNFTIFLAKNNKNKHFNFEENKCKVILRLEAYRVRPSCGINKKWFYAINEFRYEPNPVRIFFIKTSPCFFTECTYYWSAEPLNRIARRLKSKQIFLPLLKKSLIQEVRISTRFFSVRILFFRPRLNILIFLSTLVCQYSCKYS